MVRRYIQRYANPRRSYQPSAKCEIGMIFECEHIAISTCLPSGACFVIPTTNPIFYINRQITNVKYYEQHIKINK